MSVSLWGWRRRNSANGLVVLALVALMAGNDEVPGGVGSTESPWDHVVQLHGLGPLAAVAAGGVVAVDDEGPQRGLVERALLVLLAVDSWVLETLCVELGGLDVDVGDGEQSR